MTISSLVIVLGLVLILCFTLFSLKSVEIDWRTSHSHITATHEEILKASGIKKGGSVFFQSKKKYIKKIEAIDPYIDVINIETTFPSSFVIHIAERQEVYALAFEGGAYICDEDFRVLRVAENFESESQNPISLSLPQPAPSEIEIGEYLDVDLPPLYQALFENNRTLGEQCELIRSVALSKQTNSMTGKEEKVLTLSLFSGQTVKLVNADRGLVAKVKLMLDVFSQMWGYIGKSITTPDGEVELTAENLKTCTIEIHSYLSPSRGENECYFNIFV